MVGVPLSLVINWISQEYNQAFIVISCWNISLPARFRGEPALSLLTRLRKKAKILDSTFTPALPHLPLHSCLLSPTVPYSIPLLGSSLVRTSTSLSSRPLSCVLCLVIWGRRLGKHTLIGSTEFISFQRGIRCLSLFSFPVRRRSRLLSI